MGNGSSMPSASPSAAGLSRTSTSASDVGALPSSGVFALRQRETLDATDLLYLKNVLLKFLDAQLAGRTNECEVLLPAVATLLRASPQEFKLLREGLQRGTVVGSMFANANNWLGSATSSGS